MHGCVFGPSLREFFCCCITATTTATTTSTVGGALLLIITAFCFLLDYFVTSAVAEAASCFLTLPEVSLRVRVGAMQTICRRHAWWSAGSARSVGRCLVKQSSSSALLQSTMLLLHHQHFSRESVGGVCARYGTQAEVRCFFVSSSSSRKQ